MEGINIVLRILWTGGVTRVALEEARNIPGSKLIAYRRARTNYDLSNVDLQVLFEGDRPNPLFRFITSVYAKQRGSEATVDLDRIIRARDLIKGPSLFHDQFVGIGCYQANKKLGLPYSVFITPDPLKHKHENPHILIRIATSPLTKDCLFTSPQYWIS